MKFETKLNRILKEEKKELKKLKLYGLGFDCVPGSKQRKIVDSHLYELSEVQL